MFLAMYSNEMTVGIGESDIVLLINDACDLDEANELAEDYAVENGIKYVVMDVIDLDDFDSI